MYYNEERIILKKTHTPFYHYPLPIIPLTDQVLAFQRSEVEIQRVLHRFPPPFYPRFIPEWRSHFFHWLVKKEDCTIVCLFFFA